MAPRLRSVPWAIALGLVLGGALGNLTDRLFRAPGPLRGEVVDFISLFSNDRSRTSRFSTSPTRRCAAAWCSRSCSSCPAGIATARGANLTTVNKRQSSPKSARGVSETRSLPVPDGLDGMRLDQAVSRLFGLSRTAAAALVEAGDAVVDGFPRPKSDKVSRRLLARGHAATGAGRPVAVEPMASTASPRLQRRRHRRRRQAGRRRRAPEPWLDRPDRHRRPGRDGAPHCDQRRRRAPGHRAPARRRHHRADGRREERDAPTALLKRAFKEREVDKRYHAVVQGHLDPLAGYGRRSDRSPSRPLDYKYAVVSGGQPSVTHYDTLEAFPSASLVDVRLETGRTHQIRVHFSAHAASVCRRSDVRRRSHHRGPAAA